MNVKFYTFSKRVNSTARPTGGTDYTVILKEPSSVISPRLDLIWTGTGSPTAFNYAYIGDFGRYYWVTNWEYQNRKWTATLSVDVLASWKTEIGSSAKYVLRSAADSDPSILDNYYPPTADEEYDMVAEPSGWTAMFGAGCYVINVSGYQNSDSGLGVTLYQQTAAQAYDTIKKAYDDIYSVGGNTTTVTDTTSALEWLGETAIRFSTDLSQYINGYMWFPALFQPTGTPQPIRLGLVDGGVGIPITTGIMGLNKTLSLPTSITTLPRWKTCAPYCFYTLEFLPFGTIPIDSIAITEYGGIFLNVYVDAFTGIGTLRVMAGSGANGPLLAVRTAQVGVPVRYGTAKIDLGQSAANLVNGITQTVVGAAEGDLITAGSGIMSAARALVPDAVTGGQTGNISAISDTIRLWIRRLEPTGEDPTEYGKPLCNLRTINTLGGYTLCRDGDISAPATQGELDQIAAYLTGGFFYD